MHCVQWVINRHDSFQWWSRQCNWHKWLSDVWLTYGHMIIYKPNPDDAISHSSTLNYRQQCTSVIVYYLPNSFMPLIYHQMHEKESKRSKNRLMEINNQHWIRTFIWCQKLHEHLVAEWPLLVASINLRNNRLKIGM